MLLEMVAGTVRQSKSDIVLSTLAVYIQNDKATLAALPSGGLGCGVERISNIPTL